MQSITAEEAEDASKQYFTKTVAFQGQVSLIRSSEQPNQIKAELIKKYQQFNTAQASGEGQQIDSSSRPAEAKGPKFDSESNLTEFRLTVIGLQPFICDIVELNLGMTSAEAGASQTTAHFLKNLKKRQIVSPFNLTYSQSTRIQLMSRKEGIRDIRLG